LETFAKQLFFAQKSFLGTFFCANRKKKSLFFPVCVIFCHKKKWELRIF